MPSVEELLNSDEQQIETYAEENEELVIDGETRVINIPESEVLFGVKGDKNIERKYFRCPKIVGDNVDLSKHLIYIAYVYTESNSGSIFPTVGIQPYHCDDVAVDGDDITFSWKLSDNVFQSAGFIVFKMYAKEKEDSPYTVFNTTPAIGTVLYTIGDGVESIVSENPDIINQLIAKMESVQEIATPEAMQGYVNQYLTENPVEVPGGLPSGGTTGQVLSKDSDSDFDATWKDAQFGMTEEEKNQLDDSVLKIENIENTLFGESKILPWIIDSDGYIISGDIVIMTKGDNLLKPEIYDPSGFEDYFDVNTGKWIKQTAQYGYYRNVKIDRTKKYYLYVYVRTESGEQSERQNMFIKLYGSNTKENVGKDLKTFTYSGQIFDASELDEYEYYSIRLYTSTGQITYPAYCAIYFGETEGLENVLINDFNSYSSSDYKGWIVLGGKNSKAEKGGITSGITSDMPSSNSCLLVDKNLKLSKYINPYNYVNKYDYLEKGDKNYFCWNHNMIHYDKEIHKYIYICKNKTSHTSGDRNILMYIIDPSNFKLSEPKKIHVNSNQITWFQGFVIKDDGTWILADCDVETYDTPKMIISRDHGSTFEIIGDFSVQTSGGYFNSISLGFNGRIFGAYDDGTVGIGKNYSVISYSDDNGLTWNDITIDNQKFVEQLILPISETRLALIGRYNAYGSAEQMAVTAYSDDNGLTWNFFNSDMKMHSNDCAGFVHDGLIELFCLERYYTNSFRIGDMSGQLTHYIGTEEDFVNNKMIEYETFYLQAYESGDLGHPSACMDEYGGSMVIFSANNKRVQNNTYPVIMYSDNNKNPLN